MKLVISFFCSFYYINLLIPLHTKIFISCIAQENTQIEIIIIFFVIFGLDFRLYFPLKKMFISMELLCHRIDFRKFNVKPTGVQVKSKSRLIKCLRGAVGGVESNWNTNDLL